MCIHTQVATAALQSNRHIRRSTFEAVFEDQTDMNFNIPQVDLSRVNPQLLDPLQSEEERESTGSRLSEIPIKWKMRWALDWQLMRQTSPYVVKEVTVSKKQGLPKKAKVVEVSVSPYGVVFVSMVLGSFAGFTYLLNEQAGGSLLKLT
jgi:allophanate hydrolase subunit 1